MAESVATLAHRHAFTELVIELPQVYTRSLSKGDPNDLITLALTVGAISALCGSIGAHTVLYRPSEWKGQVSKNVTEARARKRLTEVELKRIELPKAAKLKTDVWDAIGIGLHFLRR